MPALPSLMSHLTRNFAATGKVDWIGVRPERTATVVVVDEVEIRFNGLHGDYRENPGKRAVSLIQAEHLPVIAALSCVPDLVPELLRRNIVVSGINLLALRKSKLKIGNAVLLGTGLCAPCSKMETALGKGGFTAMRGHGGITAEVISEGRVRLGDRAEPILDTDDQPTDE